MSKAILKLHVLIAFLMGIFCSGRFEIDEFKTVKSAPKIEPDYSDIVIPPNIAPMNFEIKETGRRFMANIYTDAADGFQISSRSSVIDIPAGVWRKLLTRNKGKSLYIDIFTRCSGGWIKYKTIKNRIAREPLDRYLVYRFFRPNYTVLKEIQIRQRDLENFDETLIMSTKTLAGCVNCHAFNRNDPSSMLMHIRWGDAAGTLMVQNGCIEKIDTRTDLNSSPGSYPAWHPGGGIVAFSVNKVYQFFHAVSRSRDVIDISSDLILYHLDSNSVVMDPNISSPRFMETYPEWSPKGRYLYFARTLQLDKSFDLEKDYQKIKYNIVRVPFNVRTGNFGAAEVLVSAEKTGKSATHPRVSPDNKFVLFCMSEYGNFPIFRPDADLYLYSLKTKQIKRLNANSNAPEGYHCWSSNGRWIVFTTKRDNAIFTRLYLGYIDAGGNAHKAFVVPRKNPGEYQTIFMAFSVPELIMKPVPHTIHQLLDAAWDPKRARRAQLADTDSLHPDVSNLPDLETMDYP